MRLRAADTFIMLGDMSLVIGTSSAFSLIFKLNALLLQRNSNGDHEPHRRPRAQNAAPPALVAPARRGPL